ncbi:MAG: hypothetical protein V9G04_12185 [Nocardioides sp.]|jgi:uncharacterized membrane protein YczE
MNDAPAASMGRRLGQLLVGCVVLGVGIALLLAARLGADGYTMLVSGTVIASGVEFWVINTVLGLLLVLVALLRGRRPGLGTLVQPVVVGVTVSLVLPYVPEPESLVARALEFGLGFLTLALGVAMYLAVRLGAGPAEGAALAFDPPLPFKWSYSVFQAVTTLVGWALGATLGIGTLIVIVGIGPLVDRLIPLLTPRGDVRPAA